MAARRGATNPYAELADPSLVESPKKPRRRATSKNARKSGAGLDVALLGHDKPFFRIGEVAEILGVATHVLRYWESEFSLVRPRKSKAQHRVYRRQDVENLLKIKYLLHERRFTLAGAKQELKERSASVPCAAPQFRYRLEQSLARVQASVDALAALVRRDILPALAADPASLIDREIGGDDGESSKS
jgi:DNA-binding transcriptional MerR regulator